ncbi:hypothetical protein [Ornithinimicrobium cavernae]|uniref:hypothetical protein n=1 Tax=Ornithinimicrobium cavernae TaxID=2666047 RepID=UPI0012B186FD|nr:hypothetical protein [Ornithinimicrobium cavernae]
MTFRTAAQNASRPRRAALSGLALAAALTLSGCQISSPVTTDMNYDPADGVSVDAGQVAVRDLLVVSEGNGAPGTVSGLVVNNTSEPTEVTVTLGTGAEAVALQPTLSVAPGQSLRLDGQGPDGSGTPVQVPAVEVSPGGSLQLVVQTSQGEADSGLAPVLLPEGPYSDIAVTTADVPS